MSEQNRIADITQLFSCWCFETNYRLRLVLTKKKSMHDRKSDTIYELLRAQAERAPGCRSYCCTGSRCSELSGAVRSGWTRLLARCMAEACSILTSVAIVLPNGPEMAVTFVGVAASAICAPLNPAYSRREFEFYLSDLKPKALIVQSGMNSAAVAVAEERAIAIIELSPKPEAAGRYPRFKR